MALQPTNLGSQYMMKVRIHNNNEGRGQHPELTGQRLRTKSVTSQFTDGSQALLQTWKLSLQVWAASI